MNSQEKMLVLLQDHNEILRANGQDSDMFTVLKYIDEGEEKYVEDYSPFANEKYMSSQLLNALKNGQTLTERLRDELDLFRIERYYDAKTDKLLKFDKKDDTYSVLTKFFKTTLEAIERLNELECEVDIIRKHQKTN